MIQRQEALIQERECQREDDLLQMPLSTANRLSRHFYQNGKHYYGANSFLLEGSEKLYRNKKPEYIPPIPFSSVQLIAMPLA